MPLRSSRRTPPTGMEDAVSEADVEVLTTFPTV